MDRSLHNFTINILACLVSKIFNLFANPRKNNFMDNASILMLKDILNFYTDIYIINNQ